MTPRLQKLRSKTTFHLDHLTVENIRALIVELQLQQADNLKRLSKEYFEYIWELLMGW